MNVYQAVVVTINAMSIPLVLLLLYSNYQNPQRTEKRKRMIITLYILLFWMIGETISSWCLGKRGTFILFLAHVSQFVIFFNVITFFPCYQRYLRTENHTGNCLLGGAFPLRFGIYGVSLLMFILAASNPVTHVLFRIDREIGWTPGPLRLWVDYLLTFQCILILLLMRDVSRKYTFPKYIFRRLNFYMMLPILAVAANTVMSMQVMPYPLIHTMLVIMIALDYINLHLEVERNILESNLRLEKSRVKHLTWQIHPHFLFNSLVVIKELCSIDSERAEEAIQNFADYLRDNLEAMNSDELVPFTREIQVINHYVSLEKADPASSFEVIYELEETDFMLPVLTVEPLVENAIRHGLGDVEEGGTVWIRSWREKDLVYVSVSDNGSGFGASTEQVEKRKSMGLENVRERLETQCGGSVTIDSSADGTCVTLLIPWREQDWVYRWTDGVVQPKTGKFGVVIERGDRK